MEEELERAYKQVDYLAQTLEITMKELEECKDAIEIKDRYINGHKGEMTSLNRENIQLRADLVKLRQELEEYQKFKFRRMLAYGLPEDCTLSQLEVHEDHVQRERARLLYDGIILEADLARTQRALELACKRAATAEVILNDRVLHTQEEWEQKFLAQAGKNEKD